MVSIKLKAEPFPKDQLLKKLEENGIYINRYAEKYFAHPSFQTEDTSDMVIVIASLQEIGLENGATLEDLFQQLGKTGLKPCPANAGLFLRLEWRDQPQSKNSVLSGTHRSPDQAVTVLSEIMERDDSFPKGLYLRNVDGRLWLRGYVCDHSYRFSGNDLIAFKAESDCGLNSII